MKYSICIKFMFLTSLSLFNSIESYAQSHCTRGVSRWSDISSLAPIKGLDIEQIIERKSLRLNSESGTYTLRERNGQIYVQTPMGNSNVKVCRLSGNKLQVTATVLGVNRTVLVEVKNGRNGVIHADGNIIPFNAAY